jgi:hypothetical protein
MFIRKRRSSAQADSYQVIETYRENGGVRQRVLANLGPHPTIEEALATFGQEAAALESYLKVFKSPLAIQGTKWELNRVKSKIARLEAVTGRAQEMVAKR